MRYQFLTDESVVTHINLDTATAEEEKRQLFNQGFKVSGDIIEADSAGDAQVQFNKQQHNDMKFVAVMSIITGALSAL